MPFRLRRSRAGYVLAIAGTAGTTAVMSVVTHYAAIPNISLLYLPIILVTAVYFGTGPSLTAAALSALEYDLFLLHPAFAISMVQAQDVLALAVFILVAVICGQLALQVRSRAEEAHRRAVDSVTLYELAQVLMSGDDVSHVLEAMTRRIVEVFDVDLCAIFVPDQLGNLQLAAETARGSSRRDRASLAAAASVYRRGNQVGAPLEKETEGRRVYVPLRTPDRVMGVMEIGSKRSGDVIDDRDYRVVTSFAAQAALVISRAEGQEERRRLRVLEESDRLKSALLSAVSHDLRTPLASIKASATSLLLADAGWTLEQHREFLQAIDQEADRLDRLVGNLLDLSRIEAGTLRPVLDWYDIQEVTDHVLPRIRPLLGKRPFTLDVQRGIPPVRLDLLRIEQLLINLVENAAKYSPAGSPITIRVASNGSGLSLAVIDHGPGVPASQRDRIFDRFYRLQKHSDRDPGTGLGLAICRGITEAHGGTIHVEDTPGGGATFVLTLPAPAVAEAAPV
jgi:two-component system sensor histidine kinase KdpD